MAKGTHVGHGELTDKKATLLRILAEKARLSGEPGPQTGSQKATSASKPNRTGNGSVKA